MFDWHDVIERTVAEHARLHGTWDDYSDGLVDEAERVLTARAIDGGRRRLGLNRADLARSLGVPDVYVWRWLSELILPAPNHEYLICETLKINQLRPLHLERKAYIWSARLGFKRNPHELPSGFHELLLICRFLQARHLADTHVQNGPTLVAGIHEELLKSLAYGEDAKARFHAPRDCMEVVEFYMHRVISA